jgi:hypothetical protein
LSAPFDSETQIIQTPHSLNPPKTEKMPRVARATYEFSRLCFKKAIIELLSSSDEFRVITPVGMFQMSKAKFYEVFANVVQTRSYQEDGIYHYTKVPKKALQFLL